LILALLPVLIQRFSSRARPLRIRAAVPVKADIRSGL
jgi:hypothetical protein